MIMNENDRGTGKTFRKLLIAIFEASKGNSVLFYSSCDHSTNSLLSSAYRITEPLVFTHVEGNSLVFNNGGKIKFISIQEITSKNSDTVIIIDD